MLSICIPIYNFDVRELVAKLHGQLEYLNFPCEIICIDDCSEGLFADINSTVCRQYSHYIMLDKNIGRSKIRNLFLEYAKFDYLLFLDCDSVILSNDFILKYIDAIKHDESPVICGGRVYGSQRPDRSMLLRWKYGHQKESIPVSTRQLNPNRSFMTNNFMISKELFKKKHFEERLVSYGHEDTLFGYQLKKEHIQIQHIDNPILNGDLETNAEFLAKTELGLRNLVFVVEFVENDPALIEDVTLLSFYAKCRKWHITWVITALFSVFRPLFRFLLSQGFVGLLLFDFYKLGFFAKESMVSGRKLKSKSYFFGSRFQS